MIQKNILDRLPIFVAVAQSLSFSTAAKQLAISPSAASQAVRDLEERLGTLLLRRSTRHINLTDAGADYLAAVAPALAQLERATQDIAGRSVEPSGPLRLTMPRAAFEWRIAPLLKSFQAAFPGIVVEVDVEGRLINIVAQGFDAGIRYGDLIEQDMVAVKIAGPSEAIVVASSEYLASIAEPLHPTDLPAHPAVVCRRELMGPITPWILSRGEEAVQVAPQAKSVVQDLVSEIDLIVRGVGIGCVPRRMIADHLRTGKLIHLLKQWSASLGELFLFFPSQRHKSAALQALITFLRSHPSD